MWPYSWDERQFPEAPTLTTLPQPISTIPNPSQAAPTPALSRPAPPCPSTHSPRLLTLGGGQRAAAGTAPWHGRQHPTLGAPWAPLPGLSSTASTPPAVIYLSRLTPLLDHEFLKGRDMSYSSIFGSLAPAQGEHQ